MTDKIVVLITARNLIESKKIARRLVQSELAACVNIVHPVRSIYRWQGRVEDAKECLLLAKSSRGLFPEIEAAVKRVHSYETPEIICVPVVDGSEGYLGWLGRSVKTLGAPDKGPVGR